MHETHKQQGQRFGFRHHDDSIGILQQATFIQLNQFAQSITAKKLATETRSRLGSIATGKGESKGLQVIPGWTRNHLDS